MESNTHDSSHLGELFKALAAAQSEMSNAVKSSENPYHKSSYADLSSCINAARPCLSKNGLCVLQQIVCEGDSSYLVTKLGHTSGQWIESKEKIRLKDVNNIQTYGSTLTYLRRYSFCALVGVAPASDDDDGERAMARHAMPERLPVKTEYITAAQVEDIIDLVDGDDELLKKVLAKGKIADLKQLEKHRFDGLIHFIEREKQLI